MIVFATTAWLMLVSAALNCAAEDYNAGKSVPVSSAAPEGHRGPTAGTRSSDEIEVVAFIRQDSQLQVGLRHTRSKEIAIAGVGESAFGYRVDAILLADDVVILNRSNSRVTLSMHREQPAPAVAFSIAVPAWITERRKAMTAMTPEDKTIVREEIRATLRQQWEGGLADAVSKLDVADQVRVRAELSRLWLE